MELFIFFLFGFISGYVFNKYYSFNETYYLIIDIKDYLKNIFKK
jgi:hypothetical protein